MRIDLYDLDEWNQAQARTRAEYAHHPTVTGHHDGFLPTCPHCQRIRKEAAR